MVKQGVKDCRRSLVPLTQCNSAEQEKAAHVLE